MFVQRRGSKADFAHIGEATRQDQEDGHDVVQELLPDEDQNACHQRADWLEIIHARTKGPKTLAHRDKFGRFTEAEARQFPQTIARMLTDADGAGARAGPSMIPPEGLTAENTIMTRSHRFVMRAAATPLRQMSTDSTPPRDLPAKFGRDEIRTYSELSSGARARSPLSPEARQRNPACCRPPKSAFEAVNIVTGIADAPKRTSEFVTEETARRSGSRHG
jgi:hypothetical protein